MSPAPAPAGAGPGTAPRDARSFRRTLPALLGAGVLGAAATTHLVVVGNEFGRNGAAEDLWFFDGTGRTLGEGAAWALTMSALALLAVAWLLVGATLRRGTGPGAVLAVGAVWAAPLLVGPPLFSPDVYAYAAIGTSMQHGVDPFVDGPAAAGPVEGIRGAEPFWAGVPTPYSPPFVVFLGLVSRALGEHLLQVLVALRVLTVAAWVLLAVLVVLLARWRGLDPARAAWLTAANPLLLLHTVSGVHNDALMTLLVLAGVALALARRPYLAVLVLAAAACVKVTALALVPVVAVYAAWQRPGPAAARLPVLAGATALGIGAFAAAVQVSGWGWRWTQNLDVPGKAVEPLSPSTALAVLLDSDDPPLDTTRAIGLALGVAVCLWLLTRVPRWGLLSVAAWVSLAVVLSGAAVWPWYLTAPTVLLALTGRGRHVVVVVGWSVAGLFAALPGGQATLSLLDRPLADALALGALVLVGLVAVGTWARAPRDPGGTPPQDRQTPVERHSRERRSLT